MKDAVAGVLSDYEQRAERERRLMSTLPPDQLDARVDEFLISIGPQAGRLLHLLATSTKSRTLVELGTSYGYSTIWLADAARETGGKVHSLELSQKKVEFAREQLHRAGGLDAFVEFHVGDARETLRRLAGPFDLVLVDLWKDLYCPCFELLHPKLAPGALVAADNMLYPPSSRDHAVAYQKLVRTKDDIESILLNIGNGIELSRKL